MCDYPVDEGSKIAASWICIKTIGVKHFA